MTKTLLTGATGFVGAHLARGLAERGDDLRVTVAGGSDVRPLAGLDVEQARCDLLDRRALRRVLKGVERVFHAAQMVSLRRQDAERLFEINVGGTRTVLEECLRADVERVVLTSSAASVGPARRGETADETQLFTAGHLGIPYVNSVHEAEVEALRLAAKGLPVVCVNPALTFGPGDYEVTSTRLVRSFLLGRVPAYADGGINVVDVRDVAQGHLLADERGSVGERYILGGRNFTFDRLFADLGRISGVDPPIKVSLGLATGAIGALRIGAGRTTLSPEELRVGSQFWTYRSTKAQRELGFKARPHEETLESTVSWHAEREHDRLMRVRRSRRLQYRLAGTAIGVTQSVAGVPGRLLRGLTPFRR